MKLKKLFLPFVAGALALSLAACGGDDKEKTKDKEDPSGDQAAIEEMQKELDKQKIEDDKIVAVVNDEELNGESYNTVLQNLQAQIQQNGQDPTSEEFVEELKKQTLDTLVNQTLILQQAKAEKIEVAEEEIENEYGMFVVQFGDEEKLEEALKEEGLDPETLKEEIITESILFQKYQEQVAPVEEVSDEEVKTYYEEFAAQSEGDEELPPLEEISDNIKSILEQNQQQEKFIAHIEKLKKDAKIELKI